MSGNLIDSGQTPYRPDLAYHQMRNILKPTELRPDLPYTQWLEIMHEEPGGIFLLPTEILREKFLNMTVVGLGLDEKTMVTAVEIAEEAHRGQTRNDGTTSYLTGHALVVPTYLALEELSQCRQVTTVQMATAVTHDVVEDCPEYDICYIRDRLGAEVAKNVAAFTKPPKSSLRLNGNKMNNKVTAASVYARQLTPMPAWLRRMKACDKYTNHADDLYTLERGEPDLEFIQTYLDVTSTVWLPFFDTIPGPSNITQSLISIHSLISQKVAATKIV